jgi:hypothetical protein
MLHPLFQICGSDVLESNWTIDLFGSGPFADDFVRFDRPILSRYLQMLRWSCPAFIKLVLEQRDIFLQQIMSHVHLLPSDSFQTAANDALQQYVQLMPLNFQRLQRFCVEIFQFNFYPTAFNTDWSLQFGNESDGYLVRSVPRIYNGTCNCMITSDCHQPLRIGPVDLVLPGLVTGCSVFSGLRLSTLACFYSATCIEQIVSNMRYYGHFNGSLVDNINLMNATRIDIRPLNRAKSSRFLLNTSIATLLDEMFVDAWINKTSYEKYFDRCAPTHCTYDYVSKKSPSSVAAALLGLYGGLTLVLRFLVWNGAKLIRSHYHRHQQPIHDNLSISMGTSSAKRSRIHAIS